MSDSISLKTEPLGTELTGVWQVFRVGLAVVYHVATFGRLISTVEASELLVQSVRLRVTVIDFHEFFLRKVVFLDFFIEGTFPNILFLE